MRAAECYCVRAHCHWFSCARRWARAVGCVLTWYSDVVTCAGSIMCKIGVKGPRMQESRDPPSEFTSESERKISSESKQIFRVSVWSVWL